MGRTIVNVPIIISALLEVASFGSFLDTTPRSG
jgi:hypothetical protein